MITVSETSVLPISGYWVLLDTEDLWRVMEHTWSGGDHGYFSSSTAPIRSLHRFIIDAPEGLLVDHKNGLTWDCRKSNLRLATKSQNAANARKKKGTASNYKGISIVRRPYGIYWLAQICVDGERIKLGRSKCEIEAAHLYDAAAKKHFGEFAKVNFQ